MESLLDLPPFTSDIDGLKRQLFEAHRRLESLHSEYKSLQQVLLIIIIIIGHFDWLLIWN